MTDEEVLGSWTTLNDVLRNADEQTCKDLMKAEFKGRKRKQFVMRIFSRLNRERAARERQELVEKCAK